MGFWVKAQYPGLSTHIGLEWNSCWLAYRLGARSQYETHKSEEVFLGEFCPAGLLQMVELSHRGLSILVTISRGLSVGTPPRNDNVRPWNGKHITLLDRRTRSWELAIGWPFVLEGIRWRPLCLAIVLYPSGWMDYCFSNRESEFEDLTF